MIKKWPYTSVTSVAKTEDLTIFVSFCKIESLLLWFYLVFLQAFFNHFLIHVLIFHKRKWFIKDALVPCRGQRVALFCALLSLDE